MRPQNTEPNAALLHPVRDAHPENAASNEYQEDFAAVLSTELREIEARRKACGLPPPDKGQRGLVGLALSGGGIRSASFSLGVVQALAGERSHDGAIKKGYLKQIDYLSTVSGGGYLGACLSSLLKDKDATALEPEGFPLRKQKKAAEEGETEELTHLRNGSNYLNPPESTSSLTLPTVVLRGIILTFVALLPMIYLAVFITGLLYETLGLYVLSQQTTFHEIVDQYWPRAVGTSAMLFATLGAFYPFVMRWDPGLRRRGLYLRAMSVVLKLTLALLLLKPASWLINEAAHRTFEDLQSICTGYWDDAKKKLPNLWWAIGPVLAGAAGLVAQRPQVLRALGLGLAAVAGPILVIATYLGLCIWQVHPVRSFTLDGTKLSQHKELWALLDNTTMESWTEKEKKEWQDKWGNDAPVQQLTTVRRGKDLDFTLKPLLLIKTGGTTLWDEPGEEGWKAKKERAAKLLAAPPRADGHAHFALEKPPRDSPEADRMVLVWGTMLDREGGLLLLLCALSLFLNARFLNINHTSPHGFYRDQLSRVFLRQWGGRNKEFNDTLKLSELRTRMPMEGNNSPEQSVAPYHLINATVNLSTGPDDLRGRHGDFFLFSKHYVGGAKTGWMSTKQIEALDRFLDLGTAMAISAAAASPNMGLYTSRALSFLMMMLNVRLGYWLPNPRLVHQTKGHLLHKWTFLGPGPIYLWKEALGKFNHEDPYINVSDGGHIENLGVYELLRRKCRLIIAVDGEADPKMGFPSLGTLLRFARIDLGVTIKFDEARGLEDLRKREGYSKAHWAKGTITY